MFEGTPKLARYLIPSSPSFGQLKVEDHITWSLCVSHGVFSPGPSLSQTKYSYRSVQTCAACCSHYPLCHTDTKYYERVHSDESRVLTPHQLIVSTATNPSHQIVHTHHRFTRPLLYSFVHHCTM